MGCCCIKNFKNVDQIDQSLANSRTKIISNKEADVFKEQGNIHFKNKAYQNAIKCYNDAIMKNPNQLVYYTNLALTHKAIGQFQEAIKAIDKMKIQQLAVSSDNQKFMIKGIIIKARCINSLTKKYIMSNEYTTQENENMLCKIENNLKMLQEVRKKHSAQAVNEYLANSLKLKTYLVKLKKNTPQSQVIDYLKGRIKGSKQGLQRQQNWKKLNGFFPNSLVLLKQMEDLSYQLNQKLIEEDEMGEQYLIDPIIYQKFVQPVLLPSGITYEQSILRQYFKKGEYRDPITKQKFQVGERVMVKNNAVKNYIFQMGKHHEIKKQDIQLIVC